MTFDARRYKRIIKAITMLMYYQRKSGYVWVANMDSAKMFQTACDMIQEYIALRDADFEFCVLVDVYEELQRKKEQLKHFISRRLNSKLNVLGLHTYGNEDPSEWFAIMEMINEASRREPATVAS